MSVNDDSCFAKALEGFNKGTLEIVYEEAVPVLRTQVHNSVISLIREAKYFGYRFSDSPEKHKAIVEEWQRCFRRSLPIEGKVSLTFKQPLSPRLADELRVFMLERVLLPQMTTLQVIS